MRSFQYPGGVYNATPPRVVFGPGSVAGIADEVTRLGAERALIISTPGRVRLAEKVRDLVGDLGIGILDEAISQVPIELARRGREKAHDADCLISVGGGAATGLSKGIALDLGMPIINIPTTYSGSEMTGFCGITIDGVKRMHTSLNMLASTVVYDAELTTGLPPSVSASSAMNALAHCIDALYLPTLSPLLAAAAVEGAEVIARALPEVLADPARLESRNELLYGAYLGGAALTGGFALQHGVAHALGGSFGVEHGLAHAIVLPHVTGYLEQHVDLGPIAEAFKTDHLGGAVHDLLVSSGLPASLAEVGLTEADLDRATAIILETESDGAVSPVPVTEQAVAGILRDAYIGRRPV
jgi:maleylacetate reductase